LEKPIFFGKNPIFFGKNPIFLRFFPKILVKLDFFREKSDFVGKNPFFLGKNLIFFEKNRFFRLHYRFFSSVFPLDNRNRENFKEILMAEYGFKQIHLWPNIESQYNEEPVDTKATNIWNIQNLDM
jgi:hypothetical protein